MSHTKKVDLFNLAAVISMGSLVIMTVSLFILMFGGPELFLYPAGICFLLTFIGPEVCCFVEKRSNRNHI